MEKVNLPSGAILELDLLSFADAWEVTQLLTAELEKINVDLKSIDFSNVQATDIVNLKGPICAVLSNKQITAIANACFKKCIYNGLRIDANTFEKKEARADYLPVVFHALRANVTPFFANLLSFLEKK